VTAWLRWWSRGSSCSGHDIVTAPGQESGENSVIATIEQAKWFGDDLALKADFRRVDFASAATGSLFMLRHLGAGRPMAERVRLGMSFAGEGRSAAGRSCTITGWPLMTLQLG
jgi:hypothetical protein